MSNWLENATTSNRMNSTYIKGFLDISGGDLFLRNGTMRINNNTIIQGTAVINTSLGINTTPTYPIDISGNANFRNNLYVSNDLSLTNRLSVNGNVSMNGNLVVLNGITGTVSAPSDYRIKNNIEPLNTTEYKIDSLRPVIYDNKLTKKPEFGLIAHEVQEIFPFVVNGEKDGPEYQSVNYTEFISLLIHEVQQMKQVANSLLPIKQIILQQQEIITGLREQNLVLQNIHNNSDSSA